MIPKMLKEMERRAKELLDNREKLAVVKADETARNKLIAYYEKEIVEAEGFAEEIHQEYRTCPRTTGTTAIRTSCRKSAATTSMSKITS